MSYSQTSKSPSLTRSESYQYDLAGNMTKFTDRKSQANTYTYDGINRRTGGLSPGPMTVLTG
jgi:YD repeat-containing protein